MGRATWAGAALVALGCIGATGCSQMQNPRYDLEAAGCRGVPEGVVAAIERRLEERGALRNAKQVEVEDGGATFVSAELHVRGTDPHDDGEILTWVGSTSGEGEFQSVDEHARERSSWPPAELDVAAPGARESRACTARSLGKTAAQLACEIEQNSGNNTIGRDVDCGDR